MMMDQDPVDVLVSNLQIKLKSLKITYLSQLEYCRHIIRDHCIRLQSVIRTPSTSELDLPKLLSKLEKRARKLEFIQTPLNSLEIEHILDKHKAKILGKINASSEDLSKKIPEAFDRMLSALKFQISLILNRESDSKEQKSSRTKSSYELATPQKEKKRSNSHRKSVGCVKLNFNASEPKLKLNSGPIELDEQLKECKNHIRALKAEASPKTIGLKKAKKHNKKSVNFDFGEKQSPIPTSRLAKHSKISDSLKEKLIRKINKKNEMLEYYERLLHVYRGKHEPHLEKQRDQVLAFKLNKKKYVEKISKIKQEHNDEIYKFEEIIRGKNEELRQFEENLIEKQGQIENLKITISKFKHEFSPSKDFKGGNQEVIAEEIDLCTKKHENIFILPQIIDKELLKKEIENSLQSHSETISNALETAVKYLDIKILALARLISKARSLKRNTINLDFSESFSVSLLKTSDNRAEKLAIREKLLVETVEHKSNQINSLFAEIKELKLGLSVYSQKHSHEELLELNKKLTLENDKLQQDLYQKEAFHIPSIKLECLQKIEECRDLAELYKKEYDDAQGKLDEKSQELVTLKAALKSLENPGIKENAKIIKKFEHSGTQWVFVSQDNSEFWVQRYKIKESIPEELVSSFDIKDFEQYDMDRLGNIIEEIKIGIENKANAEQILHMFLDRLGDRDTSALKLLMLDYKQLKEKLEELKNQVLTRDEVIQIQATTISNIKEKINDSEDKIAEIIEYVLKNFPKNRETTNVLNLMKPLIQ